MPKKDFKEKLLGVFEISLFMKSGTARFDGNLHSALRSFIWPILILPVALFAALALSPGGSLWTMAGLHTLRIILTLTLSLGLIYIFCRQYHRSENFLKYVTVANWFEIALFALICPALILLAAGMPKESLESYIIFSIIAGYVYSAYILTHTLRIPWQMGGCLAIGFLLINQTGFEAVETIRQFLYPA